MMILEWHVTDLSSLEQHKDSSSKEAKSNIGVSETVQLYLFFSAGRSQLPLAVNFAVFRHQNHNSRESVVSWFAPFFGSALVVQLVVPQGHFAPTFFTSEKRNPRQ